MFPDTDSSNRRIPSLVQFCQRVAAIHVDSISSLGGELSYEMARPILERCNADQLSRLEGASPHLQEETPELWKQFCFCKYPTALLRYSSGEEPGPESWKDHYFVLQEAETRRLEEVGIKLRTQRLEAEERKREREVKISDRLPPPKRAKTTGWGTAAPRKSLFQKTRTEASKMQKNMYNAPIIPPMFNGKNYRVLPKLPDATLPTLPPSNEPSRVTVKTVVQRRSVHPHTSPPPPASFPTPIPGPSSPNSRSLDAVKPLSATTSGQSPLTIKPLSKPPSDARPVKRDLMSTLFVPKHRAHSQRRSA